MSHKVLNLQGELLDLSYPRIMGILNATPDSFFSGSRIEDSLKEKAAKMVAEGLDIFDVGGYSTRPGAKEVSAEEETDRVVPVIGYLKSSYPQIPVSVDTFRAEVARNAAEAGAGIINDVSGGNLDDNMFETVAKLGLPYVLMHMRGTPETMSSLNTYKDLTADIISDLSQKLSVLRSMGVKDVIIDPGFGFAKTGDQNFTLLKDLKTFELLECPVLVGVSRKKMIYEALGCTAADALNGSTVLHSYALLQGASILRVHDVKEAYDARKLLIDKSLVD